MLCLAYIELTFDGFQIAGQDVAWDYAVTKEGMAQAQGWYLLLLQCSYCHHVPVSYTICA